MVVVGVQRMSAGYTVRLHGSAFTSANHQSEEVPGLFGAIIGTAGAWAAGRLQGGWERACPQQTQEGLLHLLSCRPTHPHPSSFVPPPVNRTSQLRPAGETAGWCYRGERRVYIKLGEGSEQQ